MGNEPKRLAMRRVNAALRRRRLLSSLAVGAVLAFAGTGGAAAQNVSFGKEIWATKIECNSCHGWAGDGNGDDAHQPRGASLRDTQLTREQIIEVVKCGRIGSEMPHFDPRAYKDDRCYGVTAADLGDQTPIFGGKPLIKRELEALADYIEAEIVGKGPITREQCLRYFGDGTQACERYKPAAEVEGAVMN